MSTNRFCTINGRQYRIGDVVLDLRPGGTPKVHVHEADGWKWFIARVNPNCDQRASESLGAKGFRIIQPREDYQTVRSRQTVWMQRAIFPRYLFLGLPFFRRRGREEIDFTTPCRCDGVEGLVRTAGAPVELVLRHRATGEVITGEQIAMAMIFNRSGATDEAEPVAPSPHIVVGEPVQLHPKFRAGQQVRMRKGPLAPFVATIMRAEPNKRIEVLMRMLGQDQTFRLRARDLEPAS